MGNVRKANGELTIDQAIGAKIRARRLELKLSQSELGSKLGITFQQIQKYERGSNRVAVSRLISLARALSTDTDYFLAGLDSGKVIASEFTRYMASREGAKICAAMLKLKRPQQQAVIELAQNLALIQ